MDMNEKLRELIAIGASITANCQPCLQAHVDRAINAGACNKEVTLAMEVGHRVKEGAAAKMKAFSSDLQGSLPPVPLAVVMEGNGRDFLGP